MPEFTKTQKLTEREQLMQRIREGRSSISEEAKLDFLKQTGYSIGYLNNALYGKVTPSMRFIKQFNKIVKVAV